MAGFWGERMAVRIHDQDGIPDEAVSPDAHTRRSKYLDVVVEMRARANADDHSWPSLKPDFACS